MKKFKFVSFVFVLSFILLGSNASTASAFGPYNDFTPGCTSEQGYSPTTGAKCEIIVYSSLPHGCTSTIGYSPTTGVKCDSLINTSLPAGCTSTVGYSPTTGVKCDSLVNTSFPPGCFSTQGFSTTTGQRCDGTVTPTYPPGCTSYEGFSSTTGMPCNGTTPPVYNQSPVISGVNGPQSLNVNQLGTWSVSASDINGGSLSYSVYWGDEPVYAYTQGGPMRSSVAQQSATFTHAYSQSGNYTPTFTVTNSSGQSAQTSLSVNVGNATSISNLTITTSSTLSNAKVGWPYYTTINTDRATGSGGYMYPVTSGALPPGLSLGGPCSSNVCAGLVGTPTTAGTYNFAITFSLYDGTGTASKSFTLNVDPSSTAAPNLTITTSSPLPNAKVGNNYQLVLGVSGGLSTVSSNSYTWSVSSGALPSGLFFSGSDQGIMITGTPTAAGTYSFTLNTSFASQSGNKAFTLTVDPASTTNTNHAPVISSAIMMPSDIRAGQSANFGLNATDADNDDLFWGITDWGDGSHDASECIPVYTPRNTHLNWNYSVSHTWANAGHYTATAYATDCRYPGGTNVYKTFSVDVGSTTPTTLGDTNLDGTVRVNDALLISLHIEYCGSTGQYCLTGQALANADVNADGRLTSRDATLVANYAGGTIRTFPIER